MHKKAHLRKKIIIVPKNIKMKKFNFNFCYYFTYYFYLYYL